MNGGRNPRSEPNGRARESSSPAFLPIAVVFFSVAIAMMSWDTTAWIAFFTMGVTFLIIGMPKPATKNERPAGGTSRG